MYESIDKDILTKILDRDDANDVLKTLLDNEKERTKNIMGMRAKLHTKIMELRKDICDQTWKNNGQVKGTVNYSYMKFDDIKKNIAPLLADHKLEYEVHFPDHEVEKADSTTFKSDVIVGFEFIDTETGYSETVEVPGSNTDRTSEKALIKAISYAHKAYLGNKFMLADGIDPDKEASNAVNFFQREDENQTRSLSQALASSQASVPAADVKIPASKVQVRKVADAPKAEPKAEPAPEIKAVPESEGVTTPYVEPKAEVKNEPEKAPESVKVAKSTDAPTDAPKEGNVVVEAPAKPADSQLPVPASKTGYEIPDSNLKTLNRMIGEWKAAFDEGKISEAKYNSVAESLTNIGTLGAVRSWIANNRVVKE